MTRKVKKNGKFILIYASILFCSSILFSNFFSERMATTYNRYFLESRKELIEINYSTEDELHVSYIPSVLNGISNLDYYYDFGTFASNIGTIGINVNDNWKLLPLYKGKWRDLTEKNKVILGKDAYHQLDNTNRVTLFGEVYEVVGVLDNLSGNDYFSDFIIFDLDSYEEKTYPQSLSSVILFGSPESVAEAVTTLTEDTIFIHDDKIEFPTMEEYIKIFTGESKKIILEFGLLIILTLIIISGNYLNEIRKEISIRKWIGNSYCRTVIAFVINYMLSLFIGGIIAFLIHSFSYYVFKVNIIQRPYVEVWYLFFLIGIIIFTIQTMHISFVYLSTTALDFLKGAEE